MSVPNLEIQIHKLYKYCLKLSGSPWVAEDLVQETMLKVFLLKQKEPHREFTHSFLCTVARNLLIDDRRKQKGKNVAYEDIYGKEDSLLELDSLMEILLTRLPLKYSMLITLKDVFGYSSKEIAAMLRVSNEVIKTALHRSRKKLKSTKEIGTERKLEYNEMISGLLQAIKQSDPIKIFHYYRQLEASNFRVRRMPEQSVFHVIDPDGNVLELLSS